jgi:uncharacterized protein with GYD domain
MPTFMLSLNWTDQGIRKVKDAPKRNKAAKELAKKVGIEIKHVYLTSGDDDLLLIVDTPNGDNVAKFALARLSGKRAYPNRQGLALVRISQTDFRTTITSTDEAACPLRLGWSRPLSWIRGVFSFSGGC